MAKTLPNVMKNINLHVQESQQISSKLKEIHTDSHQCQTDKSQRQENLDCRKSIITYKESSIRSTSDFS